MGEREQSSKGEKMGTEQSSKLVSTLFNVDARKTKKSNDNEEKSQSFLESSKEISVSLYNINNRSS